MKGLMILGTASDVGKSLITTAICRMFANEGVKVAPFKSQNMSNNSYVTLDGNEIGRAQGIQAEAAKTEASVYMNPILLKPKSELQSEVVLLGKVLNTISGKSYRDTFYEKGLAVIKDSLTMLSESYDVIVMEGAGSPVEINLKEKELVNMKVAEIAEVPAILVADIDRGGVFASIVGTLELLTPKERRRVKGIIINKFRGDQTLFDDGVSWIEERTGIPVLGVIPYMDHMIEGEDSLSIAERFSAKGKGSIDVAVVKIPYISNYSDIEPFLHEVDISIRWIERIEDFGNPDALIIPGTKSTISDLQFLMDKGLVEVIRSYVNGGGMIVGICGGYQMMCKELVDPVGVDTGEANWAVQGLGIIPARTIFQEEKTTVRVEGKLNSQINGKKIHLEGYEIHLGETEFHPNEDITPFLIKKDGEMDGYYKNDGQIIGTYLHHLFHNDGFRNHWLDKIRKSKGLPSRESISLHSLKDKRYDDLAELVKENLDWDQIKRVVAQWQES
ncbi:MAG TPA: cobyric acid synthase [Bacillales bacterium]|nr:cobyric acid synthase [Bacillales bacterium]